jgi:hypothetical protein
LFAANWPAWRKLSTDCQKEADSQYFARLPTAASGALKLAEQLGHETAIGIEISLMRMVASILRQKTGSRQVFIPQPLTIVDVSATIRFDPQQLPSELTSKQVTVAKTLGHGACITCSQLHA